MKKDTKQALRKVSEATAKRLPEEHCHLGKDLDLLITRAWNEGQNEKARADEQILAYARMDEEKIARQVEAEVKAIADKTVQEIKCEYAVRRAEWERREKEFVAEAVEHRDSLIELISHKSCVTDIDSIIILAVGDVDAETAMNCMTYAMALAFRGGEFHDDHVETEEYHIGFQSKGENGICVIVWTQDEWKRTRQLGKARNQVELVKIANRLARESRRKGVGRMAEYLGSKGATL